VVQPGCLQRTGAGHVRKFGSKYSVRACTGSDRCIVVERLPLRDSLKVQVRAEIFNVINRPNLAQPNNVFGTEAFGRIFTTLGNTTGMGTARQILIALRLFF
jgi:hypothetical protein